MTEHYALIGNPVEQSLSPQIHQYFAKQTGKIISYKTILATKEDFADKLMQFVEQGGKGLNITSPFKETVIQYTDKLSATANLCQAANLISINNNGKLFADNVDGIGLCKDISNNLNWPVKDKNILLLGAGGAARGVLADLAALQPKQIIISNRTPGKAKELAALFTKHTKTNLTALSFYQLATFKYDIIINATSCDDLPIPDEIFNNQPYCYDMSYKPTTIFLQNAQTQGACGVANGIGMLIEQAAESFFRWCNIQPTTEKLLQQYRAENKK